MPRISVICVTNREQAVDILHANLDKQTFTDFELILADDLADRRDYPLAKYKVTHFKPRGPKEGEVWNLNKAYNDALSKASGELLVFYQDFIWIPANGLQRFWDLYENYPSAAVSGVGHKAIWPDHLPITDFDRPTGISETDDRVFFEKDLTDTDYSYWELNWASCPRKLMVPFEESMDRYYGSENQVVAIKLARKGTRILVDKTNRCVGYNQALFGRPEDWEENHHNKEGRFLDVLATL